MGFFDSVLDTTTKKNSTDGSFLVINDDIKAEALPDTAIQIFDTTPVSENTTHSLDEVSFFSEPVVEISETSLKQIPETVSEEVAFFEEASNVSISETTNESADMEVEILNAPTESKDDIISFINESTPTDSIIEPADDTEVPVTKDDIYAPMKRAIAEYEKFLSVLMKDATHEDDKIEISNAQIAEAKEIAKRAIDSAKESAKVALENRKRIDAEMKRIEEMKNVLSLQVK